MFCLSFKIAAHANITRIALVGSKALAAFCASQWTKEQGWFDHPTQIGPQFPLEKSDPEQPEEDGPTFSYRPSSCCPSTSNLSSCRPWTCLRSACSNQSCRNSCRCRYSCCRCSCRSRYSSCRDCSCRPGCQCLC